MNYKYEKNCIMKRTVLRQIEEMKNSLKQVIKSHEDYLKKEHQAEKKLNGEIDYTYSEGNKVTEIGIIIGNKEYKYNVKKGKITVREIKE